MCLVLKLDNGKVVSIANGQTDRQSDRVTEPSTTVLVYRYLCLETYIEFTYFLVRIYRR